MQNTSGSGLQNYKNDVEDVRDFIGKRHAAVVDELDDYEVSVLVIDRNIENHNKLQVFPDPAKNYFNIVLPNVNQGKVEIQIINLLGQSVFLSTKVNDVPGKYIRMDLPDISAGTYILIVKSNGAPFQQNLILLIKNIEDNYLN